jgi:hypothetical protein
MQNFKAKSILDNFVELTGNVVPTSPRGFSDHEAIDLIRHKTIYPKA